MKHQVDEILAERDAALRSLDEVTIRLYAERYGIYMPDNHLAFWAGVHKARLQLSVFSESERALSMLWLLRHGFDLP